MAKYNIDVPLIGNDGDAYSILAQVERALRNAKVSANEISEFHADATSGDYGHLLGVVDDWVNITSVDEEDEDDDEFLCSECEQPISECECDDDYDDEDEDED